MVNAILNTLVALLVSGATLSFNFNAADAGGNVVYDGRGELVTAGNNYRMETDDVLIVSNGTLKGIYRKGIDEIVLMGVASDSGGVSAADIIDNPFAVLQNPGDNYSVTASAADSKGIPRKIVLKAKNGAVYTITVLEYSALPAPDCKLFTLNLDDYPTAVVTDLR